MRHIGRRLLATAVAASLVGVFLVPASAMADQAYHSERLPWVLTEVGAANGHPELRAGHDVNAHPNGPVWGAIERYMIGGALANTEFQVVIHPYFAPDCSGEFFDTLPSAVLTTNKHGNAHGGAKLPAAFFDPFPPDFVVGVQWDLVVGFGTESGYVAYQTPCTVVTID